MRVLITNDDSITGQGLEILTRWARRLGDVTVMAPKVEQSAKSHGIEIHRAFEVRRVEYVPGVRAYTVDSTPADCIRYAVLGMEERYDLVLSGVNRGLNIGRDIIYSGTVGAVMEAAYLGIPAIAFSTEPDSFRSARENLEPVFRLMEHYGLLEQNPVYNVNIPADVRGVRFTRQGGPYFSDKFRPIGNDLFQPMGGSIYEDHHEYSIDTDATLHGYISITPLSLDRTERQVYARLEALNGEL